MGLDTSHDAWHGSYSGFTVWRNDVARALGILQRHEQLYLPHKYSDYPEDDCPVDWEHWWNCTDAMGNWTEEPEDPVWYLLAHSDCDGVIKHEHLIPLADRLEPLIPVLDDSESISYHRSTRTRNFVEGLRRCHEAGEDLDFH
jgi:hypothetical protein